MRSIPRAQAATPSLSSALGQIPSLATWWLSWPLSGIAGMVAPTRPSATNAAARNSAAGGFHARCCSDGGCKPRNGVIFKSVFESVCQRTALRLHACQRSNASLGPMASMNSS